MKLKKNNVGLAYLHIVTHKLMYPFLAQMTEKTDLEAKAYVLTFHQGGKSLIP